MFYYFILSKVLKHDSTIVLINAQIFDMQIKMFSIYVKLFDHKQTLNSFYKPI